MKARQALITGGTSGVGKQLVFAAAQRGYSVTFLGRDRYRGAELQRQLRKTYPTLSTDFAHIDLESLRDLKEFAEDYVKSNQRIDLLANVAGGLFATRSESIVDKGFVVSCLAGLLLTQTLLPKMSNVPGARIINVGASPRIVMHERMNLDELENHGELRTIEQRNKNYSPFASSALAVHAKVVLTQCLAEQIGESNVSVNAFHPGAIRSRLYRGLRGPARWGLLAAQPFLRSESATANRAAFGTAQANGALFAGSQLHPLKFKPDYRRRMWEVTATLLSKCLAAV